MTDDTLTTALRERAGSRCELCAATDDLRAVAVPPDALGPDRHVFSCATCADQLAEQAPLDAKHWFCLQEAAWSEVPAVQVVSWRLLQRLAGESWAADLLGQLYVPDEVLAWAKAGAEATGAEDRVKVVDCHGTELHDGDTVHLVKNLDVKGGGFTAKRGTVVKGIRLGDDPTHVEGRVNNVAIYLKTEFLKKASG